MWIKLSRDLDSYCMSCTKVAICSARMSIKAQLDALMYMPLPLPDVTLDVTSCKAYEEDERVKAARAADGVRG